MTNRQCIFIPLVLLGGLVGLEPAVSWAQKPPPPIAPNPQAPLLSMPAPMGVQRGTMLDLTLTGTNLAGPTAAWTSFPAKIVIPTENKNGSDNTKLQIKMEVPADAPLGFHALRLATTRGMSNLRLFCVDDLPQVVKAETNKNKSTPQAVPVPCVVAGRVDAEQGDYYKITVAAGQRVSFDVLGRRLGGPIDPQLTLYDLKSGREIAFVNDTPGCQTDPRLTHVFKEAGDYLVEVKDVLFRGGADYVYRLRIGDFPCATVPIPMAAKRGSKVKVDFAGPMVEGVAPVEVTVPTDPAVTTVWVAPKGASGLHGWPVALGVSDLDESVEKEPNNEPAKANPISVPGAVTGRFQQGDDVDCYRFTAKKGQKIQIDAETLELYSPTLTYLVVKNAKGAELAKSAPAAAPPLDQRIDFTAPDDGDYILEVSHLTYLSGPSEAYRVTLVLPAPDFDLTLGIDRYDLAPGSVAGMTLQVNRRGYTGPIEVELQGPMGLFGKKTIPAGATASVLLVEAKPELPKGAYVVSVLGRATIDGKSVTRPASVRTPIVQSLGGLAFPPRHLHTQIALAVKERAPFQLITKFDPDSGVPGLPLAMTIQVKRDEGFDDAITLNPPGGLPPNLPVPKLAPIAKGQNEVKIKLDLNPKVPFGDYVIFVSGAAKHQGKDYLASSVPTTLAITKPFALKVEPDSLSLAPGAKGKVKIAVTRKGGYNGPIAIELRNLPANVTGAKGAIAMGQNMLELEVTAAANAAVAEAKTVDVLGTATALANMQNNSPAFTVKIEKK
jgi:hypothetical protein